MTMVTKPRGARAVSASEFKARCLQLMDEVDQSGVEIVITKRGRPVSRLVPYRERPATLFGMMSGRVEVRGEVVEPVGDDWEAAR